MSEHDELATWLRAVIGERLALARHVITVQAEVESGIVKVPAEQPPASARWHEQSSGVLWTGEGSEDDCWYGTWAMGDSRLTRFIADNDPETVIAGCEAELALLDEYERYWRLAVAAWEQEAGVYSLYDQARTLKRTVRRLGWGYRHRAGYREAEWAP